MQCRRRPVAAAPSATQFFTQPEEGGGGEGGEHCQVIPGQLPHPSGPAPLSPICWTLESSTELVRRKGGGAAACGGGSCAVRGGGGRAGANSVLLYTAPRVH